ncbi:MAG: YiiX/YebB-like N1pC/P60 family cysteine hydrolase [Bacteroidia bacterium]|nr:YiiX/YebB-like N1pC/P60 family cysteine hydrolase [Bacteroidia bacterium]
MFFYHPAQKKRAYSARYNYLVVLALALMLKSGIAQTDSAFYQGLINEKIQKLSINEKRECWLIAGTDSSKIYRIDSLMNIRDKTGEIRKYTRSKFTTLITIGTNKALIGTNNDKALMYDRGKIIKLTAKNGIIDDSIQSFSFSRKNRRIYIETPGNGYVSTDSTFRKYARFTQRPIADSLQPEKPSWTSDLLDYISSPVISAIDQIVPDIDISPRKGVLIKNRQIREINKNLEPCDILFKRNNWFWTNNVIDGFWTHTGIYIGDLKLLNEYFKGIPVLNGMKASTYIRKHYPRIFRRLFIINNPVIEAITDGVSINNLKHIASTDYFAALRPRLSREDKFLSLLDLFRYYMLPYDYSFDFGNKNAMVCSELVYKGFCPTPYKCGIHFQPGSFLGSPFMYPADFVKKFDDEYGEPGQELDFVLFYDASEKLKKAFRSNAEEFRTTWKRSRFGYLQK